MRRQKRFKNAATKEHPVYPVLRQGYCQYGQRCHFVHARKNMEEIKVPVEEKVDTGKYNMFSKEEEEIPKTKRTITVMPVRSGRQLQSSQFDFNPF